MTSGDVVLWYGYPIRLLEHITTIGSNVYWMAESLYREDRKVEMYSIGGHCDFGKNTAPVPVANQTAIKVRPCKEDIKKRRQFLRKRTKFKRQLPINRKRR